MLPARRRANLSVLFAEESVPQTPRGAMQEVSFLGFERGERLLHVQVELGGPADSGAALSKVAFGPLGHYGLVSDNMSDEVEEALRHLLFDDEVGFLDDDLLANVIQGHEDRVHP